MDVVSPELLRGDHHVVDFDSGEASLDDWLIRTAWKSQEAGDARTFVVRDPANDHVIGFHSLAAGVVERGAAPGRLSRNAPDPIPVIVIARLAVDLRHQNQNIGTRLLIDAISRAADAAKSIGARAITVNPISESAARFYEGNGFMAMSDDPTTMYLRMVDARSTLAAELE